MTILQLQSINVIVVDPVAEPQLLETVTEYTPPESNTTIGELELNAGPDQTYEVALAVVALRITVSPLQIVKLSSGGNAPIGCSEFTVIVSVPVHPFTVTVTS